MREAHQVIVVGAGPAGASTAYFLARADVDVLLVDRARFPRDKPCGDALSPRALRVIRDMGLLETVTSASHAAAELHLFAPNHRRAVAPVPATPGAPRHVLVIPRLVLDHLLQRRAVEAGAEFRVGRVAEVLMDGGAARGARLDDGSILRAPLVVIATGAATGLLRRAGMLPRPPRFLVAARGYLEGLAGVEPQIEFYFDEVPLPGYGWLFPTGSGSANVGIGWYGSRAVSTRAALERLVASHPRLRRLAGPAREAGAIRGHPLRIDYATAVTVAPGVVAVGEAAGLVNPFTGEGIDYALESGQIAAECIAEALDLGLAASRPLRSYERRLEARFRPLFVALDLARRAYYNRPMLDRIFGRPGRRRLVDALLEVCFGHAHPARAFSPRALLELLRP